MQRSNKMPLSAVIVRAALAYSMWLALAPLQPSCILATRVTGRKAASAWQLHCVIPSISPGSVCLPWQIVGTTLSLANHFVVCRHRDCDNKQTIINSRSSAVLDPRLLTLLSLCLSLTTCLQGWFILSTLQKHRRRLRGLNLNIIDPALSASFSVHYRKVLEYRSHHTPLRTAQHVDQAHLRSDPPAGMFDSLWKGTTAPPLI